MNSSISFASLGHDEQGAQVLCHENVHTVIVQQNGRSQWSTLSEPTIVTTRTEHSCGVGTWRENT